MFSMKRVFTIIILFYAATAFAQSPKELFQQGNQAYGKADYQSAIKAYETILNTGYESALVYYNLGNSYYRQDEYGQAILNYERALRLKPHFRDCRQNLALAYSKTEDNIESLPELLFVRAFRALVNAFSITGWGVAILIVLALLGGSLVILFLMQDYSWRKASLISAIVLGILLALTVVCTIASGIQSRRHNQAIVTQPMVIIKGSPDVNSVDKMVVHEGTKVGVDETLDGWHKVSLADGNTGWVEVEEVTVI